MFLVANTTQLFVYLDNVFKCHDVGKSKLLYILITEKRLMKILYIFGLMTRLLSCFDLVMFGLLVDEDKDIENDRLNVTDVSINSSNTTLNFLSETETDLNATLPHKDLSSYEELILMGMLI